MNLKYDKTKINWKYGGKEYEYFIDNIFKATEHKEHIFIISSNSDDTIDIYTFITLTGKLILSESMDNNNVSITILNEKNEEEKIDIQNVRSIVNISEQYIYVIAGKWGETKLVLYSYHGKKIKEFSSPENYNLERFLSSIDNDKDIKIISYGPKDQYDKDTYCLSLNSETCEWTILYSMLDK